MSREKPKNDSGIDIHIPWGTISAIGTGIGGVIATAILAIAQWLGGIDLAPNAPNGNAPDITPQMWLRAEAERARIATQVGEHERRLNQLRIPPPSFEKRVSNLEDDFRDHERGHQ